MKRDVLIALILAILIIGGVFVFFKQFGTQTPEEISKQTIGNQSSNSDTQVTIPTITTITNTEIQPTEPMKKSGAPKMEIDANKNYSATVHTSEGDITIEFNAKQTPITVNNFIYLAKKGFYNDSIFHRVIKDFMIQGGDPTGTGAGGPGYKFNDEKFEGEYTKGTVAMANAGPNTNGSQFFIMHGNTSLPKNYVIFGKVTKGIETVDKIAEAPVQTSDSGEQSKPVNPVKITSIEVSE
ncbi:MAG: peptidylprolyl isomerase [Candidatus Roizmanbacteria bacterium]